MSDTLVFMRDRRKPAVRRPRADVTALTSYAALAVAEAPVEVATTARWAGPIVIEGQATGDGRMIAADALRWEIAPDNRPLIRYVTEDVGAHDGAVTVGAIDTIERRANGVIWGEGDFDLTSAAGREAYRQVSELRQNGVSVDLDDVSFEIRVASELLELMESGEAEVPEPHADGTVTVATIHSDDEIMLTTSARVRAATIVAVPAFADARITIVEDTAAAEDDDETPPGSDELTEEVEAMVASAVRHLQTPLAPPAAWFADQRLTGPTALKVTAEGQVYGHLALWGTCHISHTGGGNCVTPPNSPSGYSWFHTGAIELADGSEVAVGHLTMGTGHARDELTPAATLAHYDNTGTVVADVRAYEDAYGIAVVGALRPGITAEQRRAFRAAPLSGDWRRTGTGLELVAALSVNVPGFGIPRPSGMVAGGHLVSLVASGIIVPMDEDTIDGFSRADIAFLRSFVSREKRRDIDALAARRNKVRVAQFTRRRKG